LIDLYLQDNVSIWSASILSSRPRNISYLRVKYLKWRMRPAEILKMFSFASNLLIMMKDTLALGVRVMVLNATFNNISIIS
jgi:hypothetical protein